MLLISALTLVLSGLVGQLLVLYAPDFFLRDGFAEFTDLNGESNLPATFSTLLLFIAALLLSFVAAAQRQRSDLFAWAWRGLAAVFFYLALDENAMFHERTMGITRQLVPAAGPLHYAWVIPYGIAGAVFLVVFYRFILQLPATTRRQFLIAGTCYVMGAYGMELIEGQIFASRAGTLAMIISIFLEESAEMLGVILFISAVLGFIRTHLPAVRLSVALDDQSTVP